MGLFASSKGSVQRPGVFPIEVAAPTIIEGVSNGFVGICLQSEWGDTTAAYKPTSSSDMLAHYFPAGSARTSTGWYAVMKRKRVPWCIVRILHSDAVKATQSIAGTGGNVVTTALYYGPTGNSISYTQGPATDGNSNHKKFTFTLDAGNNTGTTVEVYDNVAFNTTIDISNSKLLSVFTSTNVSAWPADGTHSLASGSNGSAVTAADYNAGLNLLALEDDVRVVVVDDCGSGIRAGVNADLVTHVGNTTDRIAILQDDQNASFATTQTNVASYRTDRVKYVGAWVYVKDDNGVKQASPFATFMASAIANLEPQQSEAWWADAVTDYYTAVDSVYAPFSTADTGTQDQATTYGIALPIKLPSGRFASLHDRTTSLTLGKRYGVTRRLKDYFALSIKGGIGSFVNSPNLTDQQRSLVSTVNDFCQREFAKGRFSDKPLVSAAGNDQASIAAGQFTVSVNGTTPAPMEQIFIQLNVGPTVTVVAQ